MAMTLAYKLSWAIWVMLASDKLLIFTTKYTFLFKWQTKLYFDQESGHFRYTITGAYKKQEICCTAQNESNLTKCRPVFMLTTQILFSIKKYHMDKC